MASLQTCVASLQQSFPWIIETAIVSAFLVAALFFQGGFFSRRHAPPRSGAGDDVPNQIKAAQDEEIALISTATRELTAAAPADRLKYIGDRLAKIIDYTGKRHDWFEDQRSRILQIIIGLSSAIFVIAGWISKNSDTDKYKVYLFGFVFIAFIGLIFSVYHYNAELDVDRPYRLVSDIKLWFFRYNLPGHSSLWDRSEANGGGPAAILTDRKRFFERASGSLEPPESFREDLEQIFILHVLQRYKSESLLRMRWLLGYFLTAFGLQTALWILCA